MPKIQLTIDPNYCRDWGFFEGVRELLQNAKDAEEFDGLAMTVEHRAKTEMLVISTKGITLEASTLLLLGCTTKADGSQRGKFGEGFALGCLALTRAGHAVTIYNGGEVWRPEIAKAEDGPFAGNNIFLFNTRSLSKHRVDFTVEIEGVSAEIWAATKKLFLFLECPAEALTVKLANGTVLMEEAYQGLLYVRGIFVMRKDDLEFGYDLTDAVLDRDRRMIEEWNLKYVLGQVWQAALLAEPDKMRAHVYRMAKENKPEVHSLHYQMDENLTRALREEFEKEHGNDAVPVSTMTDARELAALGAKTAMVTSTLHQLLSKATDVTAIKEKLRGKVKTRYNFSDLVEDEAAKCIGLIEPLTAEYVIVDFHDASLCRTDANSNALLVARELLHKAPEEIVRAVATTEARRRNISTEALLIERTAAAWQAYAEHEKIPA